MSMRIARSNVFQEADSFARAMVTKRFGDKHPMLEPLVHATYWFASRKIPAYLRTERMIRSNKKNFDRLCRRANAFLDRVERGAIEVVQQPDQLSGNDVRVRFKHRWYVI